MQRGPTVGTIARLERVQLSEALLLFLLARRLLIEIGLGSFFLLAVGGGRGGRGASRLDVVDLLGSGRRGLGGRSRLIAGTNRLDYGVGVSRGAIGSAYDRNTHPG